MGDFNIMTQNSILINFGVDFIIEIVNLKKLEYFIPCKTSQEKNPNKSMIFTFEIFNFF